MPRSGKGSQFERDICRTLSLWWTGNERDDVFWRSSQSGGRATVRGRKGLRTAGSYGDITALDPVGTPLMECFTIELKRGSTYSSPGDLIDFKDDNSKHPWIKCLVQAREAHMLAGSIAWLLICKRDHRKIMVYGNFHAFLNLAAASHSEELTKHPYFSIKIRTNHFRSHVVGIPLEKFLKIITPKAIRNYVTRHQT